MKRRTFAGALAGLAAAPPLRPADADQRTKFYTFNVFQLRQGTQSARMHDWFRDALLPKLAKIHAGPKIVLEAVIAPHSPQIAFITGFSSFEEIWTVLSKLNQPDLEAAWDKIERGAEPPYDSETLSILQAAPYSPDIATEVTKEKRDTPRYFELRRYHSPTGSQLRALHQRFAGPEIKIFHRSGIHPMLYSSTLFGANMPNLTYLIPFDSLAAREKAWSVFAADPEWIKARDESIAKFGQIVSVSDIAIYRATPYSPIS
jgi:NIPSNAP